MTTSWLLPLGIRLNNPGNIKRGLPWAGMAPTQTHPTYVTFQAPEWGVRAIARILMEYEKHDGIRTVGAAIARWAPPSENDTVAYVADVCPRCGVLAQQPVSLTALLPRLIPAIIAHECENYVYDNAIIAKGIALAQEASK